MNATLDAPGTRCALESHGCSRLAIGAGGFDEHAATRASHCSRCAPCTTGGNTR